MSELPATDKIENPAIENPSIESPAFPRLLRILAVVLVFDVVAFGVWSFPALRSTSWSAGSVWVFGLAAVCVMWMGYWILRSRTRLDGEVMTQTWLWTKRADAHDVVQLKLVHIRWLERAMAPRLLVRRRNGAITWFHSADPRLLTAFMERVADCAAQPATPSTPTSTPTSTSTASAAA